MTREQDNRPGDSVPRASPPVNRSGSVRSSVHGWAFLGVGPVRRLAFGAGTSDNANRSTNEPTQRPTKPTPKCEPMKCERNREQCAPWAADLPVRVWSMGSWGEGGRLPARQSRARMPVLPNETSGTLSPRPAGWSSTDRAPLSSPWRSRSDHAPRFGRGPSCRPACRPSSGPHSARRAAADGSTRALFR